MFTAFSSRIAAYSDLSGIPSNTGGTAAVAGIELVGALLAAGARLRLSTTFFFAASDASVSLILPASLYRAGGRYLGRPPPLVAATVVAEMGAPPCTMMLLRRLPGMALEEAFGAARRWPAGRSTAAPPAIDLVTSTSTVMSVGSGVSMAVLEGRRELSRSGEVKILDGGGRGKVNYRGEMSLSPNRSRIEVAAGLTAQNAILTVPRGKIAARLNFFFAGQSLLWDLVCVRFRPETEKRRLFYSFHRNAGSARDAFSIRLSWSVATITHQVNILLFAISIVPFSLAYLPLVQSKIISIILIMPPRRRLSCTHVL